MVQLAAWTGFGKGGVGEGLDIKEDLQGLLGPWHVCGPPGLPYQDPKPRAFCWPGVQHGEQPEGQRSIATGPATTNWPPSSPPAWLEVPSQRPEPLNTPQRHPGNSVSVFIPTVSASESFNLTADCIKIPVVIGSGAVFSMRILNQAFCPHPERSASEYKDAGDGITQGIFPPLNFLPRS